MRSRGCPPTHRRAHGSATGAPRLPRSSTRQLHRTAPTCPASGGSPSACLAGKSQAGGRNQLAHAARNLGDKRAHMSPPTCIVALGTEAEAFRELLRCSRPSRPTPDACAAWRCAGDVERRSMGAVHRCRRGAPSRLPADRSSSPRHAQTVRRSGCLHLQVVRPAGPPGVASPGQSRLMQPSCRSMRAGRSVRMAATSSSPHAPRG